MTVSAAAPLAARAGPLLSGYGGPGQGNQAILGSTLLGGPGGGASGSGAPGGPSSQAPVPNGGASSGTSQASRATHAASVAGAAVGSGHGRAGWPASGFYPGFERTASTGTFGLSGADFSFVVLATAALVLAGVLVRRMARPRAAKGHR